MVDKDLNQYRGAWGRFDDAAFARDFQNECDLPLPEDAGLVDRLVAKLEKDFPQAIFVSGASRVKNGAWLWQNGRVEYGMGIDQEYWVVSAKDNSTSFHVDLGGRGGIATCDCQDTLIASGVGKTCAHYFAVRLYREWFRTVNPVWRAILDIMDSIDNSQHGFSIDVEYIYAHNTKSGRPDVRLLSFMGGGVAHQLAQRHKIRMTPTPFSEGLQAVEWGLASLPTKLAGYTYRWTLKRSGGLQHVDDRIFYHRGMTTAMVERFQQRLADLASEAIDPTPASSAFVPTFAAWELQQIGEIRARIENGETAAQVVASLPEGVRSKLMIFGEVTDNGHN